MTREEIKEAAKVMEAYANGKKIQYLNDDNEWIDAPNPLFDWDNYVYRIKPGLRYRPFETKEECWNEMHKHSDFGWGLNNIGEYVNLSRISNDRIFTKGDAFDFNKALKGFRFTDGTPFGIKEG